MIFKQFVDDDLGCASYLVGDEAAGEAVVVDPAFHVEPYLEEAERAGVRITRVLETHTHADHVSGHGRLALEHRAEICIHETAAAEYPHTALRDGDTIQVGTVSIRALHTPGHRPEHCAFLVDDELLLTGDSLFVGDIGRPDLAVDPREGAASLHESLGRLLELPDAVRVYPGHVAGSMCGTSMSSAPSSTIGGERRFNRMLRLQTVEDFVTESVGSTGLRPPNVERIVALNQGPLVGGRPPLESLESYEGSVVLDVREAEEFTRGHVSGAINIPLSSNAFGTKAAFVLSPEERIAIHAESATDAELAAQRLHAVGFLDLAGRLDDPAMPARLEPVDVEELERLLEEDAAILVDVREADERDDGYIPGSRHVPYRLLRVLSDDFDGGRPVVTICESGSRSAIAASILAARGIDARPVIDGGIPEWQKRHELVTFRRCGS